MFTKHDIRHIRIAVRRGAYDRVIYELGRLSLIHLSKFSAADAPDMPHKHDESGRIAEVAGLIDTAINDLNFILQKDPAPDANRRITFDIFTRNADEDLSHITGIRSLIDRHRETSETITAALNEAREQFDTLKALESLGINPAVPDRTRVSLVFGICPVNAEENYPDESFYIRQNGEYLLGVALPKNMDALKSYLMKTGFEDRSHILDSVADVGTAIAGVHHKIEDLEKKLAALDEDFKPEAGRYRESLCELRGMYAVLMNKAGADKNFLFTTDAVIIEGWINILDIEALGPVLEQICGGDYYLFVTPEAEMKKFRNIPIILKNNLLFRPFEMLVKNLGVPGNSEIDPTPIAALAYVIMFGVMFGDAGQGMVLCLTGIVLKITGRKKKVTNPFLYESGTILIFGGISAAIFGLLYGSVFSNEHLIPALWFHPMESMMKLFFAAVMMGTALIVIALVLNIINGLIQKEYMESIFGTRGVIGLYIYGGMIFITLRYLVFDIPPAAQTLLALIAAPLALFFLRNPLGSLLPGHGKAFPHGLFEYIVESIVETIEMFSGFMGNSISFIRAGAFALSHAGLSIAVYTLAKIVNPDIVSPASMAVIVIGNVFIILLEGLVCGIQCMRLEYYEFFSRFFRGDGVEFKPFSLFNQSYNSGGS